MPSILKRLTSSRKSKASFSTKSLKSDGSTDFENLEHDYKITLPSGRIGIKFAGSPPDITEISSESPILGKVEVGHIICGANVPGVVKATNFGSTELSKFLKDNCDSEKRILFMKGTTGSTRDDETLSEQAGDEDKPVTENSSPDDENNGEAREEESPVEERAPVEEEPPVEKEAPVEEEPSVEEEPPVKDESPVKVEPSVKDELDKFLANCDDSVGEPTPRETNDTDRRDVFGDTRVKDDDKKIDEARPDEKQVSAVEQVVNIGEAGKKKGKTPPNQHERNTKIEDETFEAAAAETSYKLCGIPFC